MLEIKWTDKVTKNDIAASKEYLTLVFSPKDLAAAISKLEKRREHIEKFKAKDLLRASQTQLLPETNEDVRSEFVKILKGIPLVPISLVRKNDKLFIADGYHRTCAAYYLNKDIEVHCVVAGID
ncbi:MAG: hypothetical protein ACHQM6_08650 [Candidatus Kapaibacterium sp.]